MRPIYLISKTPHPGVTHIPILKTRFFAPDIDFSQYDGLIVTSKQILKALEGYSDQWRTLPIIAVSESTAEVFQKEGCAIAAVADGYGEGVGLIVEKQFSQMRWLYLRPERVASLWAQAARDKGVKIDEAVMYKTECNDEALGCEIAENGILIFTSPSSIRCFCEKRAILPTHTVVAIGKTTKNALPDGVDATLSPSVSVASAVDLGRQIASKRSNSSPF